MKKILFYIIAPLVSIFAFALPVLAAHNSDAFTASSISYDTGTNILSVHVANFTNGLVPGHMDYLGISSVSGEPDDSNTFFCNLNADVTDPDDLTCTLDQNSYRPSNGDHVYITMEASSDTFWNFSQCFVLGTGDPCPGGGGGIPVANPTVIASTGELISGIQGAGVANLATLIPIGAILLISIAVVFFVIKRFRAVVRT